MIDKKHFLDNYSREFVPYKGFCKILKDGTTVEDENTAETDGPLKIICDPISHGNWHALYNLVDSNGKKILPKGIRTIRFYGDYYLLEDNNEDELINSGEVKGGFNASKYSSQMNVMLNDGTILFREWFNRIDPLGNYFRVYNKRGNVYYYSLNGAPFDKKIYPIRFGCVIKPINNSFTIFNSLYDVIVEEYTSVMWSDVGLWIVELLHASNHEVYLHGQGTGIINYAHEILIKPTVLALVEKDDIWYAVDFKGRLTKKFIWRPCIQLSRK